MSLADVSYPGRQPQNRGAARIKLGVNEFDDIHSLCPTEGDVNGKA